MKCRRSLLKSGFKLQILIEALSPLRIVFPSCKRTLVCPLFITTPIVVGRGWVCGLEDRSIGLIKVRFSVPQGGDSSFFSGDPGS